MGSVAKSRVRSNRRLGSEDDRALRGQHAAIAVRDRGLAIGDLAGAAFATELTRRLDQQEQSIHAGVAIGEAAAIGVDRHTAAGRYVAVGYEAAPLAFRAEAEILEEKDRVDRERVIELDNVDVAGREMSHFVCG